MRTFFFRSNQSRKILDLAWLVKNMEKCWRTALPWVCNVLDYSWNGITESYCWRTNKIVDIALYVLTNMTREMHTCKIMQWCNILTIQGTPFRIRNANTDNDIIVWLNIYLPNDKKPPLYMTCRSYIVNELLWTATNNSSSWWKINVYPIAIRAKQKVLMKTCICSKDSDLSSQNIRLTQNVLETLSSLWRLWCWRWQGVVCIWQRFVM